MTGRDQPLWGRYQRAQTLLETGHAFVGEGFSFDLVVNVEVH